MTEHSIAICGLPASGKTTFLAALWHLVSTREIETALRFGSLKKGNYSHLNKLATTWRAGEPQIRTELQARVRVEMNLIDTGGCEIRLSFPDLSGEIYDRMWEKRTCSSYVAGILQSGSGVGLFIHADKIEGPYWLADELRQTQSLGLAPDPERKVVPWEPVLAPTQVKLVDILQMLQVPPLAVGPRRVAVMLSAWDKVEPEGRTPEEFLRERMPLLEQYLRVGADALKWRVYGISALGGDISKKTEVDRLLRQDVASHRIRVVFDRSESNDLTAPLSWLMEQ